MKREDSVIAANLERRQIGEQFKLLDVASLPEKPYNELKRLGVMSSGAAAGLVLGLLAVGLLEHRDSTFRREEEVLKLVSLPVLALIPVMSSNREYRTARRRGWAIDIAGTAVLLAAGVMLVFWRLHS
jgi:capsular polysaccharide biosynthesis protein